MTPNDDDRAPRIAIGGARGGILIAGTAAAAAVVSMVAQLVAERALGVAGFAAWAFLSSLLTLLIPVATMGITHVLLSRSVEPLLAGRRGVEALLLHFVAFTALALALFAGALALDRPVDIPSGAIAAAVLVLLLHVPVNTAYPLFQRAGAVAWVSAWPLAQVAIRLAAATAALLFALRVDAMMGVWAAAMVLLALVAARQIARRFPARTGGSPRPGSGGLPQRVRQLSVAGLSFGLNDFSDSLDLKLIVPIASWLFADSATSIAVAGLIYIVLSAVQFFPYVLVNRVLLPAVHLDTRESALRVAAFVLKVCALASAVLIPVAAVFYWIGFEVMDRVLAGDYSSYATTIKALGIAWLPLCVSQLLIAPHMARARSWRLLQWRIEVLIVFAGVAFAMRSEGMLAILIGFAAGRTWLALRAWWALRHLGGRADRAAS